ncbi:FtsX-like permease family protein [Sphingobacterium oryzagri]|uniref:FtsX-like permease family protein n=1 Tax=Sphingobacterium oryzagri TaxID=3025669 RepID=A0ABY7WDJ9_9SPHI|nr:FtsX-like permease family protein [Sphingobacterium sp. KACC 22765]WDF67268.1 FtsX-like permease family protein [Sphingobacterium sp. KACC 22765]
MSWRWILLMAWRDSRRSKSRMLLYIASIVLGIAALVALDSFNANLKRDIDLQAAELLGADFEISSRTQPTADAAAFIDSIGRLSEATAREERFVSMIRFTKSNESRLIQVRGISAGYPFYGNVESLPNRAFDLLTDTNKLLLESELLLQFSAEIADSVQIGQQTFRIAGNILKMPGRTSFATNMAPAAVMSLDAMKATGLKQVGSRVEYFYYFKFPAGISVDAFVKDNEERLEKWQLGFASIQSTKENTGRSFADVTRFMQLVGFTALLLGAIGVSSAVHVYVQEKMVTVATLRCLGATSRKAFLIFFVQFAGIGLFAGIIGALLGTGIQYFLPIVMQDFLPVELSSAISWFSIAQGILLGFIIAVLFALLPLISLRRISPLNTLRVVSDSDKAPADPWRWFVVALIIVFLIGFSRLQLDDWVQTAYFVAGIAITFSILYAVAQLLMWIVRRFFPASMPYVWRQGLSNLFRPRNQTTIVILSVGFGTALIATLFFVQDMLLQRVDRGNSSGQANMVLFDIQPAQRAAVKSLIEREKLPVMEEVPIVTLQLAAINGHALNDVLADSTLGYSARAFRGEVRATYRDALAESEKITAGEWIGQVGANDTAQVSLEEGYAQRIHAKVGDVLLLNVQGLLLPAKVSSLRQVDWNRFQTNFRMVLAKGSLDDAPQFYVLMTRAADKEQSANIQRLVVNDFPNVSVIDIHALLQVLDDLLNKIGFVITFIGSFSILTGLVVLVASLLISKYQRLRENILLRTLGASKKQIAQIVFAEYLFLGLFAALSGVMIALVAANTLAIFIFETSFAPALGFVLLLIAFVVLLTVIIGVLNSLSALNRPALEVLRKE